MKATYTITNFASRFVTVLVLCITIGIGNVWGAVVSGTTYNTKSSVPSGWSKNGDFNSSSYLKLISSDNYIQTDEFCQNGFSSIIVNARTFGGPSADQALITVSWYSGNSETVLGTIAPSDNSLADYTISTEDENLTNPTGNVSGYIKIQCKGAGSSKGSGVAQVTINYTSGSCGGSYAVTYNANGGTGSITDSSSPYSFEATVTVKNSTGFTAPSGHTFHHWNTAADNSGTSYAPGATFSITSATTLYAQWLSDEKYVLVTDADDLEEYNDIILLGTDNTNTRAMSTTQNTNNRGASADFDTNNDGSVSLIRGGSVQIISLEIYTDEDEENFWELKVGDNYLFAAGAKSNNYLKSRSENSATAEDYKGAWRISIDDGTNEATIQASDAGTNRDQIKRNGDLFSCYNGGQTPVKIYKRSSTTATLTFNLNGKQLSSGTKPVNVTGLTVGQAYSLSTLNEVNITATGYTFAGWNESSSAISAQSSITPALARTYTLYAVWTPNTNTAYKVKHYKQKLDGTYDSTPDETDNLTGTTDASVTPARKSYTGFTAPSSKTRTILADGSLEVEYRYTRNSYTLTWSTDGDELTGSYTSGATLYEVTITAPNTPTKTGYTFNAWSPTPAATMPASATTYTATWNVNSYTITLNDNGGSGGSGSKSVTFDANTNLTTKVAVPTKAHHNFAGYWTSTDAGSTFGTQLVNADGSWIASVTNYTDASNNWKYANNLTLYAKWTEHDLTNYRTNCGYTISYECNGASSGCPDDEEKTFNLPNPLPTTPTKVGYNFVGWCTDEDLTVDAVEGTALSEDVTLYAKWTAIEYTAANNLDKNSGSAHGKYTATYDATTIAINTTPTRTGYFVEGYYKEAECTNKVATAAGALQANQTYTDGSSKWVYTSAPTLYTNWTAKSCTVNFDKQDGTGGDISATATYGSAMTAITAPTKDGYTFVGYWDEVGGGGTKYYNSNGSSARNWDKDRTEAITLYAKWTQSVTLDKNGGKAKGSATATYNAGGPLSVTAPTRTGYTVEGYYAESACTHKVMTDAGVLVNYSGYVESGKWVHSGATTLFAKWTEDTHTVTVAAGANGSVDPTSVSGVGIATASGDITATPNTGYHFVNWTLPDGVTAASTYSATSNPIHINATADGLTITANFAANSYDITLNTNGGTINAGNVTSYTYGVGATLPTNVTKTGYTFGGWYDNSSLTGSAVTTISTTATGDKEYWAKWTAITYSVRFNKNDGSATGTMDNESFTYDVAKSLTTNAFSKTGYNFSGWATSAGGDVAYTDGQSVSNLSSTQDAVVDLYAKWTAKIITITWNPNGAGATLSPTSSSYTYDGDAVEVPTPTRSLHAFDGWYTDASGGTQITEVGITNKPTADVTYYAHWRALTFEVKDQAGTGTADIHLTSTNGVAVYATSACGNLITIKATNLDAISNLGGGTANKQKIQIKYLDANNGDAEVTGTDRVFRLCNDGIDPANYNNADGSNINLNGLTNYSKTYSISYTPSGYGKIDHYKLQLRLQNNNTEAITITFDLYGRALPEEFVVAAKKGDQWYALPNNILDNNRAVTPLKITVNDPSTPTVATYAPSEAVYKGTSRYASGTNVYGIRLTDPDGHWLQVSSSSGTNYVWVSGTGSSTCQDWKLSSSDFNSYTLTIPSSSAGDKKFGINNLGNIGYYASDATGLSADVYLLPITNKYTDIPATVHEWGEHGVVVQPTTPSALTSVTSAAMNVGSASPTDATATAVNMAMGTAKFVRVYAADVNVGGVDNEGEQLYVHWKNGESVVGVSQVTIPCVVATSNDMHSIASTKGAWSSKSEVHVLPGVTLEANAGSFSGDGALSVSKMEIYPGATLKVSTGTFNATTLRLRCGWTRAGDKKYDVARVYIADDAALTKTTASMDYDIYEKSDGKHYYPLAVPFKTQVSTVDYADEALATASTYGTHYGIDKYNGESRAEYGETADNWKQMTASEYLEPGKGYTMTAVSSKGSAIIRVPLAFDNDWTADGEKATIDEEYYKNQVSVTAYSGAASTGGGANNRNAGWNMLGVPYMSCFDARDASADPSDAFIKGMLNFLTGEYTESANVYVNVPVHDFSEYIQKPVSEAKLLPGWSFFVQIGKNGTLSFATAGQEPSSTLPIYAPQREDMPVVKTGIVLSRGEKSDQTTLLISDKYSAAEYEINADLEKMFGNGYTLATYSLARDTRLAYNAMSTTDAKGVIPIGFRAPEDGEYTFALNPRYAEAAVERVDLIDYQTGEVTNLMMSDYTFTTVRTQDDERFALNVVPMANMPTGMEDTDVRNQRSDVRKIILDDKMYIIYDGLMYDATGKRVTEINK